MKYLKDDMGSFDADDASDAMASTVRLEQQIDSFQREIEVLPADATAAQRAEIELKIAGTLVDLERKAEAHDLARRAFDVLLEAEDYEQAALACNIIFQADQADALPALGQGIWLAVTWPVNPELTVALLQNVVDETPNDSDGAAVACAVAHYVVDLRTEGRKKDDLKFFTNNMMGMVARRHSNVETQEQFSRWVEKLELTDPAKFLPRMRNVVDVLVQDDWWFDREAIQARVPVN